MSGVEKIASHADFFVLCKRVLMICFFIGDVMSGY